METKIIVSETYKTVKIECEVLDVAEAQQLQALLEEQLANDSKCIIVNLEDVQNISAAVGQYFEQLHNLFYQNEGSLVFAKPSESVHKRIKQEQLHLIINVCPTMEEAVDIISMEILERDLMNED